MNYNRNKFQTVIADSQFLITESLKVIIQNSHHYSNLCVLDNFDDLQSVLKTKQADILITDPELINYEGYNGLTMITSLYPNLRILILTNQINKTGLNELTKIGIRNIILKTTDTDELFAALDAAIMKKKYYSDEILDILIDSNGQSNNRENIILTHTEQEVVKYIAGGLTTKEIAIAKHISFHTVISHRKNIFRKLQINSASELLMFAVKNGIINNIEYYI
jgi:DNA-binding NarL/FixJ family response regulator